MSLATTKIWQKKQFFKICKSKQKCSCTSKQSSHRRIDPSDFWFKLSFHISCLLSLSLASWQPSLSTSYDSTSVVFPECWRVSLASSAASSTEAEAEAERALQLRALQICTHQIASRRPLSSLNRQRAHLRRVLHHHSTTKRLLLLLFASSNARRAGRSRKKI